MLPRLKIEQMPYVFMVILILAHTGLLLRSLWCNFVTVDEVRHIEAGLSYWETGSFYASRVNPPLTKALAVLPVTLAYPETSFQALRESPHVFDIVRLSRLMGIAWSILGGLLIYRWARDLYGCWAGCLGMALWYLGPNVLAHAQLMTPDVPAAVVGLGATYVFWHYLKRPSWDLAFFAGLSLGLAQVTKYTLLLLYCVWPLLWTIHWFGSRWTTHFTWGRTVGHGLLIITASSCIVNLCYGFEGTCRPLASYVFQSRSLAGERQLDASAGVVIQAGNQFSNRWQGYLIVPLPENYLYGIDEQRSNFEARGGSYLAGEWSRDGWWYYYLYALAIKVPIGVWGLVLWSLVLTLLRSSTRIRWLDELSLWIPIVVFLVFVSSQMGINKHMRYVFPIFPFAIVSVSKLAWFLQYGPWVARTVVALLLTWAWGSGFAIYPHSLSYFNELAGGPSNGHAHIIDSNIDWGQDLLFLHDWLNEHPEASPLGLAYFNIIDPKISGIEYTLPPRSSNSHHRRFNRVEEVGPLPGYYAVSINYLRGKEFMAPNGRGEWELVRRHDFQYFRHFKPIARAGYSIYIYQIGVDQANEIREKFGLPHLAEQAPRR